jgi:hypothetical protein
MMMVDSLVEGLAELNTKLGRDVRLLVHPSGSLALVSGDGGGDFEEVAEFNSIDDMLTAMPWMTELDREVELPAPALRGRFGYLRARHA